MIFVECKPDALLARELTGRPRREFNHSFKGKYEAIYLLSRQTGSIALLDEDPGAVQPRYLQALREEQSLGGHGLKVLRHEPRQNRVVLLCPRLEEWVIGAAEQAGVDLKTPYNLPTNAVELHKEINVDLRKFQRLVEDLKDCERFRQLARQLRS